MGAVILRPHGQSMVLNSVKAMVGVTLPAFSDADLETPVTLPLSFSENTTVYVADGDVVVDVQSWDGFPVYEKRRVQVQAYQPVRLDYYVDSRDIVEEVGGGVSATLPDGGVSTAKLANDAVTSPKLADGAVTVDKVPDGTITKAKLHGTLQATIDNLTAGEEIADASDSVKGIASWGGDLTGNGTSQTVKPSAITSGKIAADAVTTAKILNANVTTAKLADDAVTTAKIADDAVTADQLATDSVTADAIAAGVVGTAELAADSVTAAKIADNAIETAHVGDGQITLDKLAANAKPGTTNQQLFTVTVPGVLATGTLADPSWRPPTASTIGAFRADVRYPPIGGPITIVAELITSSAVTEIGSIVIADKGLTGVLQNLSTQVPAHAQVRLRCTSIGPTQPGGNSLQVTAFGTGVTLPAVAAAPAAPTVTGQAVAGGVQLDWTAVSGASRYLIEHTGVPQGYVNTNTYTHSTDATDITYGVRSANLDAVSAADTEGPFTPITGTIYAGSAVAVTAGDWTITTGSGTGSSIAVSGANALLTTGTSGTGDNSKTRRSAGSTAVPAVLTKCKVQVKFKWGQGSSGLLIKTRRNAADDQGATFYFGYYGTGSLKIGHRNDAATSTTYSESGTKTTNTTDWFWAEVIDDPSGTAHELRLWADGTTRPSTADLAVASGNLGAYDTTDLPAGYIVIDQITTTPAAARTVTVAEVRITDAAA